MRKQMGMFSLLAQLLSPEEVLVWHTKTVPVKKFPVPNSVYRDTNIYPAWRSV